MTNLFLFYGPKVLFILKLLIKITSFFFYSELPTLSLSLKREEDETKREKIHEEALEPKIKIRI